MEAGEENVYNDTRAGLRVMESTKYRLPCPLPIREGADNLQARAWTIGLKSLVFSLILNLVHIL